MIIIKNVNVQENNGWHLCDKEFKKISTVMDGKELYVTLMNEDIVPNAVESKGVTLINNLFLDLNGKASLVCRDTHLHLFDDTGLVIRYRAPKGKQITSINKFTDTTSVRYIKLSKDKTEALILVTYRFNYNFGAKRHIIADRLDGVLEFNLNDKSKELVFPTNRTFEIKRRSTPVKIISTYVNNILFVNKKDSRTTIQEIMQNFILFNRGYSIVDNERDLHKVLKQSCFNEIYFKNMKKEDIAKIVKNIKVKFRAQSVGDKGIRLHKVQYNKKVK